MPSRVYPGKSAFEWHPKGGGAVKLCSLEASHSEVWAAYEDAVATANKAPRLTVEDLWKDYRASHAFRRLKPRTQDDYERYWGTLEPIFGHLNAHAVKQIHIREYMDVRGLTAPVQANREKVLLKNVYAHAFEYSKVKANPCDGVKNFRETGRDYYIEDDEYNAYYDDSEEIIQLFMELSYLNASRGQDVRLIRMSDLKEIGIFIQQQKTGKKQIKEWTDRLESVVERAKARRAKILDQRRGKVESLYLLVTRTGSPYTADGLKTKWAKNRARIEEKWDRKIEFTYHDIKAKGISDYDGDKQKFSGHKNRSQVEKYNRKPEVVKSLNAPVRAQNVRKNR